LMKKKQTILFAETLFDGRTEKRNKTIVVG
jgi:hypothetical protein